MKYLSDTAIPAAINRVFLHLEFIRREFHRNLNAATPVGRANAKGAGKLGAIQPAEAF